MGEPAPDVLEGLSPARLIPATKTSAKEQEQRATSALLAVMSIVPSFGNAVLKYLGAPKGTIETFVEPHFETESGGTAIPDGLVFVHRGKTAWTCLVEVKTGKSELQEDQIDRYLQIANREGYQGLLTISNEIVADPSESPVKVDGRRLRGDMKLAHLSWFRIMTEAVQEHQHHGVEDPEQAWILNELIEYLDDERSGAGGFDGMPKSWVQVRNAAHQGTLRANDPGVDEVAESWAEFVEYMALRLRQNLGRNVTPLYPGQSTAESRLDENRRSLGEDTDLEAIIKVPDAVAPIHIRADLRSQQVTTQVRVPAPKDHRAKTRINWLLRQLRNAPADVRITVQFQRTRKTTSLMLDDARAKPEGLLLPEDSHREPKAFEVAVAKKMGMKQGKTRGSFAREMMDQVLDFYGDVVQELHKWTAPPPKLTEEKIPDDEDTERIEVVEAPTPDTSTTLAHPEQRETWSWD
jgi:hypothetical protein